MPDNQSDVNPSNFLVPFTGLYALEGILRGSFILVDTNLNYDSGLDMNNVTHSATITISTDGVSSNVYSVADFGTLAGDTLTVTYDDIPVAVLTFSKSPCSKHPGSNDANGNSYLCGTVDGTAVHGATPFAAVPLSEFAGEYLYLTPIFHTVRTELKIGPENSIFCWDEEKGDFLQLKKFRYNYAMFVVEHPPGSPRYMLGTAAGSGKAAFSLLDYNMLFTILKPTFHPAPPNS